MDSRLAPEQNAPSDDGTAHRLLLAARHARLLGPLGLVLLLLAMLLAIPVFLPLPPPVGGNVQDANQPLFSRFHVLGTDMNGNDVASRLVHGGRTSLTIAFAANTIGLLLGGMIGAVGAYRGGLSDTLTMRGIDTFLAIPALVLVLAVSQMLKPTAMNIALTLGAFSIPAFARVARSATLVVMREPYVLSAQLCGAGFWGVLRRHITPAIAPSLLTFAFLGVGTVITIEGALSFLGFGIQLPAPSWGGMIYQGQQVLSAAPRLVLMPAALLFATVLGFNLLGQRLREQFER